jgi:tRNA modification GTPase
MQYALCAMQYSLNDTIAAIATAPGEAGIGIVRVSGAEALPLLERVFRAAGEIPPRSHLMRYGHIVDGEGQSLDEVMAIYFKAPRSYTREDVVEIHSHGGHVAVKQALGLLLNAGARLANPGEMTLRAFLNGRLDLAQAEAVLDIVQARTDVGMHAAMEQLGGSLSGEIRAARTALIEVLAHLTATIDFPEDDVPPQDMTPDLQRVQAQLDTLLHNADRGILLRNGLRVAIIGKPNVGKSSLLNRLLRTERAIVTDIPGTTRDLVEDSLNLRGIPLVLIDTAGIRETRDVVESIGVERSRSAMNQADLVLFVLDRSHPIGEEERTLAALVGNRPAVVVENKQDLAPDSTDTPLLPHVPHIHISALRGEGIDTLEDTLWQLAVGGSLNTDTALITNPRHKQAILQARQHVANAMEGIATGFPADFVTIDLHAAVNALGEITGETATEDLLDMIFSRFCIGK